MRMKLLVTQLLVSSTESKFIKCEFLYPSYPFNKYFLLDYFIAMVWYAFMTSYITVRKMINKSK